MRLHKYMTLVFLNIQMLHNLHETTIVELTLGMSCRHKQLTRHGGSILFPRTHGCCGSSNRTSCALPLSHACRPSPAKASPIHIPNGKLTTDKQQNTKRSTYCGKTEKKSKTNETARIDLQRSNAALHAFCVVFLAAPPTRHDGP